MYSTTFFIAAFIFHLVGSIVDIVSSLGFEKFRTSTGYLYEGNKFFRDKNGNFAEKKSIGAFAVVAAIHAVGFFAIGGDVGLFLNYAVIGIGLFRGILALGNWSKKKKYRRKMAEEAAATKDNPYPEVK